ncbi:MAG: metallophosphoesterase, partial [Myxococcota bacterium]|nr:metallophosphoesterase [Myxococcota bacterium]
ALEFSPDAFVLTGDVTAMSSEEEFEDARAAFGPLLDSVPSAVIPGNHDLYTRGAARQSRMERFFGPWMGGGTWDEGAGSWVGGTEAGQPVPWPVRFRLGGTDFVATNPCRPSLRSTGRFAEGAIEAAEQLVARAREDGQQVVYMLHYPLLGGDGAPYTREGHSLEDVDDLLASIQRVPPDLVLHGHKHECWRVDVDLKSGGAVPILNCGTSSAVSPLEDRTAGYYIIELEEGRLVSVRRRILPTGTEVFSDHPSTFGTA